MIQLIAMDLDGTLLNQRHEISHKNLKALHSAREQGVHLAVVSGRNMASMKQYVNQLEGIRFTACLNGSCIFDHQSGKLIYDQSIDSKIAAPILHYVEGRGIHTNYYCHDQIVCHRETEHSAVYSRITGEPIAGVGSLEAYNETHRPNKLLLIGEHEVLDSVRDWLDRTMKGLVGHFYSNPNYLEIVHHEVNKGAAIHRMAGHLKISMNQVMAFGDAENDVSMILEAGVGIAMANAPESVRSYADYITLSNDADGIAKGIETFCLG